MNKIKIDEIKKIYSEGTVINSNINGKQGPNSEIEEYQTFFNNIINKLNLKIKNSSSDMISHK